MGWLHFYRPQTRVKVLRGEHVHWIENNSKAGYIRKCVLSFPVWCDIQTLRALHEEKERMTKAYQQLYELDHVIPLSHPEVCGLSVPGNVEIRLAKHNNAKSNKWVSEWHPPQLDLFDLTNDSTCD